MMQVYPYLLYKVVKSNNLPRNIRLSYFQAIECGLSFLQCVLVLNVSSIQMTILSLQVVSFFSSIIQLGSSQTNHSLQANDLFIKKS